MSRSPGAARPLDEHLQQACDLARDSLALLKAIEAGELLSDAPASNRGRARHGVALGLLNVLGRELEDLAGHLAEATPPFSA